MEALILYTGNRLEILAQALAESLRQPLGSPFAPEWIVVQSRGMARWLAVQLARHHGICANCWFPYPNRVIQEIFRRLLPEPQADPRFDPGVMAWSVMDILRGQAARKEFAPLESYLEGEPLKLYQLAASVADLLDQYLVYRPDMVLGWERGRERHWQAALWRELVRRAQGTHRAAQGARLIRMAETKGGEPLPERISVFGVSSLPRFHMEVLAAVARWTQVNLFLLNPCRVYWGEIVSAREARRERIKAGGEDEDLHLESGNSLLASMGRLGRVFFDLIQEFQCREIRLFEEPQRQSLLGLVQADILDLEERGAEDGEKCPISPADRSLQVHACHSPLREMEALQNELLRLLEEIPGLEPRDVLVMTPDIEAYAPYVEAVFGLPPGDPRWLPFTIADRPLLRESRSAATFLAILDLCQSRFTSADVMRILEDPAVHRRFELAASDVERVRRWVGEAGVRWGMDEEHRRSLGLPALGDNTWKQGRRRLLLGYAMAGGEDRLFQGVGPLETVEGTEALLLGRFLSFVETLFEHVRALAVPRPLKAWAGELAAMLDTFFAPDEQEDTEALGILRREILALEREQTLSGLEADLPLEVIRCRVAGALQQRVIGRGFFTGGITFCALLPMRSIPARVLCLVGMNHDAYPREDRHTGFDLMARAPRPGDRSRRQDDRYLFLEAILSAREILYVSYVGRNAQDNRSVPPSVLVSELLDYVEQGFTVKDGTARRHILTRHPLQPFSPSHFEPGSALVSYSETHYETARVLAGPESPRPPFFPRPLEEVETARRTVDLNALCRFFANPASFLLRQRLGVFPGEISETLEETEAVRLGGLDRYRLAERLLEAGLQGRDPARAFAWARASGLLPHGTVGRAEFDRLVETLEAFIRVLEPLSRDPLGAPLEVALDLPPFRLVGRLSSLFAGGLIDYRIAGIKSRDRLRAWIRHLALNAAAPDGLVPETHLVGLAQGGRQNVAVRRLTYGAIRDPMPRLEDLLRLYWEGLQEPLAFFPESAWAYVQARLRRQPPLQALERASKAWHGDAWRPGEGTDPACRVCFRGLEPLGKDFEETAMRIFQPLAEHERR